MGPLCSRMLRISSLSIYNEMGPLCSLSQQYIEGKEGFIFDILLMWLQTIRVTTIVLELLMQRPHSLKTSAVSSILKILFRRFNIGLLMYKRRYG